MSTDKDSHTKCWNDHSRKQHAPQPMKSVLFLCTGNYYRSRCAEILFNRAATAQRLSWRADSRGLQLHQENSGPISPHVVRFLELQGICLAEPVPFPCQVMESDLLAADLVVAAKEAEHRPLLARDFGAWVDRWSFGRFTTSRFGRRPKRCRSWLLDSMT
jgi:low molecular weight protein-tyrosine phosphatase